MKDNIFTNLKIVLNNYDKLYDIAKNELLAEENSVKKYLIKDISNYNEEMIKEIFD